MSPILLRKAQIKHRIYALKEGITKDIEIVVRAPGLKAAINPLRSILIRDGIEANILLLHHELLPPDIERQRRQLLQRRAHGVHPRALLGVDVRAGDLGVEVLEGRVVDQTQRRARVRDGGVAARAGDRLPIDDHGRGFEAPEAILSVGVIVHERRVPHAPTPRRQRRRVDVPEGVETLAVIGVVGVAPTTQLRGEELLPSYNVFLIDHVLDGRVDLIGRHAVDAAPREAEEAVARPGDERLVDLIRDLNGLRFDEEPANGQVGGADLSDAASGEGAVAIRDIEVGAGNWSEVDGFVEEVVRRDCGVLFGQLLPEDLWYV